MFSADDYAAIKLSLTLALCSTFFLLLISVPLAWWLSRGNSKFKRFIESVVALPIVLPSTVLGVYLFLI